MRETCINGLDLDLIGILETHLKGDELLAVDGFKWFGRNRKTVHFSARTGSGGVGFLVKNEILHDFNVITLDDSNDDILWLQLENIYDGFKLIACVCYLPPENSSRQVDANTFFDNLLTGLYEYQNLGKLFICRDFNSRCGDDDDFITGIDSVCQRDVLDYTSNRYGQLFIEFLINCNMCMLNGRNCIKNDFTSVSSKGCSVVDYCIASHDQLSDFQDFKVVRASELINTCGISVSDVAPASIPDHSCLLWHIIYDSVNMFITPVNSDESNKVRYKYDVSAVPASFLGNDVLLGEINALIVKLETGFRLQSDIDHAYSDFCTFVRGEMHRMLPCRKILVGHGISNKRRRVGKPWWSDELTSLWNNVCCSEKVWLNCKAHNEKADLKAEYVRCRKQFDQSVQRAKRMHWTDLQNEMVDKLNNDQQQFWRDIGKLGVAQSKNKQIPMEVVDQKGNANCNINVVLDKWKQDFSSLNNCSFIDNDSSDIHCSNMYAPAGLERSVAELNRNISIFEVKQALTNANRGKACGTDEIQSDVLNNDISIAFIHVLMNVCFTSGSVPAEWSKGIINPIPKSNTADMRDPLSYRGITLSNSMYKLYSSVINDRLSKWVENSDILVDEQNGFRKKRSTIDHLSSVTNLIETRKKLKRSTFCAFIDLKKAYDSVNRELLWHKLEHLGIGGTMLNAVKSLYTAVSSCVRINGFYTEWFDVTSGLRQGCSLSPLLFNIFINDLALKIKACGKSVKIDGDTVGILLYADDIVLLADNEKELQDMLDILNNWCVSNNMSVNATKSNIMHFRPN